MFGKKKEKRPKGKGKQTKNEKRIKGKNEKQTVYKTGKSKKSKNVDKKTMNAMDPIFEGVHKQSPVTWSSPSYSYSSPSYLLPYSASDSSVSRLPYPSPLAFGQVDLECIPVNPADLEGNFNYEVNL